MPQAATPFAVQMRGVSKTYGTRAAPVPAVRSVDLDIRSGSFVSLMGPSGSGKSTILHLIGMLDSPDTGRMRMLGRDVTGLNETRRALARRHAVGFVFQSFNLLGRLSALHNVMLPLAITGVPRRQQRIHATSLLRTLGLGDRLHHKPTQLSGGQKQRVAIARALALDPPILLADEPTGNLDSRTSEEVMQLFAGLHRRGKTIIQVTHNEEVARHGSRIIRIRDGRIMSDDRGNPAGLPAARAGMPRGSVVEVGR